MQKNNTKKINECVLSGLCTTPPVRRSPTLTAGQSTTANAPQSMRTLSPTRRRTNATGQSQNLRMSRAVEVFVFPSNNGVYLSVLKLILSKRCFLSLFTDSDLVLPSLPAPEPRVGTLGVGLSLLQSVGKVQVLGLWIDPDAQDSTDEADHSID